MIVEIQSFDCKKNVEDEQLRANLQANLPSSIPSLKFRRALVIGGGPSVAYYPKEIAERQSGGCDVFALNGAARWLQGHGITPDFHIFYDARPENVEFITDAPGIHYLVASHVHPSILRALDGRPVTLFHSLAADFMIHAIRDLDPGAHLLGPAITVGLQALNILVVMGYRTARLYGYDSCSQSGEHHAYAQARNDGRPAMTFGFAGQEFRGDPVMAAQAKDFMIAAPVYERLGLKIEVIGEGLLPAMWNAKKAAPAPKDLKEHEAAKYAQMWQHPQYRKWAPGEDTLETFIQACGVGAGSRVIDFGCGTGRPAKSLQERGVDVLGVDHVSNCLDAGVFIPFCLSCLWELPALEPADWGYCTDVMEHIPPAKVDAVLEGIAANVRTGAFFKICFMHDSFDFGRRITGEPLHLTVKPELWWKETLSRHFETMEIRDGGIFICKKGKSNV